MDSDNCVAEGPGFNVVIVKLGIEATLRDVTSHELYDADELMAVTTAGEVTPIISLDGEALNDGTPGPAEYRHPRPVLDLDGRTVPTDRSHRVLTSADI